MSDVVAQSAAPARVGSIGPGRGVARKTVAVLIDHIDHLAGSYESQLRAAFHAECCEFDLNLLLVAGRALDSPDPTNRAHNSVYRLIHPDCADAVILLAGGLATFAGVEGVRRLCEGYRSLPTCSLGIEVPGVTSILIDNRSGMDALVEHLILGHGCRRLAFLAGPVQNPDAEERLEVYGAVLERHGIPVDPRLVVEGLDTVEYFSARMGQRSMERLLERGAEFDAVLAANDSMALGALEVLRARGIRVPRDVLLTGFDDVVQARIANPPLTTVRQPLERMAAMAVHLVVEQMAGHQVPLRSDMRGEFVPRASCGCAHPSLGDVPPEPSSQARTPLEGERASRLVARLASCLAGPRGPAVDGATRLVAGLRRELLGHKEAFLVALEDLLEEVGDRNDLYEQFQVAITLLRQELWAFASPDIEALWHDARRLIAVKNTQEQSRQRIELDTAYVGLLNSAERCSTALDLPSLRLALAEELPKMEIVNAVVARYADDQQHELEPLLCLRDGRAFEPRTARFQASRLRPPGSDSGLHRQTAFVLPLAAENETLGVTVLEFGPRITVQEMLREQISTALRQCSLHEEMLQKTLLHQRSMEERHATAERMRSLSVLAGGVAHDLNNALGPLIALPDIVLYELDEIESCRPPRAAEVRSDLHTIKAASLRGARTIQDLLTLGRQGQTKKRLLDLNGVVVACYEAERLHDYHPAIALELELDAAPLMVHGSEPHLGRAVSNLIHNALEAVEGRGRVTVRTAHRRLGEAFSGYEVIGPGDYVIAAVSDDGRGIERREIPRIFEPFFTTARVRSTTGSGLGLAIVYGVVKEHDGFVHAESTPGQGTTFTLYFRAASSSAQEVSNHPSTRVLGGENEGGGA